MTSTRNALQSNSLGRCAAVIIAGLLMIGGACATAAGGGEETGSAGSTGQTASSELARAGGTLVTDDTLTSYEQLLQMTERRPAGDKSETLAEYVMQKCIGDVYTTLSQEDTGESAIPSPYKVSAQRYLLRSLLVEDVGNSLKPTQAQLQEWYDRNVKTFEQPERILARHLFVGVSKDNPSSSPERALERITEAKKQADQGTSFALLAKKYSEASTAANGGEIGWMSYRMPFGPESKPINIILDSALFKLKPGQVTDVLKTSHGYHLLYADQRITTVTPSLQDMVSSGILPGRLTNELRTSKIKEMVDQYLKDNGGKILAQAGTGDLTSTSPAYELSGQVWTVRDLENMYGPRFKAEFARVRSNAQMLERLMDAVLEDEALIELCVARGIDKKPDVAWKLKILAGRSAMQKKFQAIVAQDYAVKDDQLKAMYERDKEKYRRRELQGHIITIKAEPTTSTSERMKAAEMAKAKANEVLAKLKAGADFEALARDVSQDELASSGGLVKRHVVGESPDVATRLFDRAAGQEAGKLSEVVPMGNEFVIVRLDETWPGEPAPFDQMKPRLQRAAQAENVARAKSDVLKLLEAEGCLKWLEGAAKYGEKPATN